MSEMRPRRISRRRFTLTASGLRRITLGSTGEIDAVMPVFAVSKPEQKPLRLQTAPTGFLLVAVHCQRGMIDAHGQEAIAAAALLATEQQAVLVLIFGNLAEDMAAYGADLVAVLPSADEQHFAPEQELAWLCWCITEYAPAHVIMPDNEIGDGDLGRRLAAHLAAPIATHAVELKRDAVAMFQQGGARLVRGPMPFVVLIAPDVVETNLPFRGGAERLDLPAILVPPGPYQDYGMREIAPALISLEEADFVVAAGKGVNDVPTVEALAAAFGAAVGASRVAVDEGKFARNQQIGATGSSVTASTYLAVGISGAIQHLQGIKACRHVIAINQDANAPIIARADLSIVGDAQEVMTALLNELSKRNWHGTIQEPL